MYVQFAVRAGEKIIVAMTDEPKSCSAAPGDHIGPRCIPDRTFFQTALELAKELGSWRDAVLALGAIVYFLGYISWALYAGDRNLGMIPVIKAQYLAAGIMPASTFLAAWCIEQLRRRVLARQRVKRFLSDVGPLFLFVGIIMWVGGVVLEKRLKSFGINAGWIFVPGFLLFASGSFLKDEPEDGPLRYLQILSRWVGRYAYCVLFLCLYLIYVGHWFPKQWQEIGGPKPMKVQMDLDTSKLSSESIRLFLPESSTNQGIARSKDTFLILETADYFFVQTNADISPTNRIFKIKSSAVESVFPTGKEPLSTNQNRRITPSSK